MAFVDGIEPEFATGQLAAHYRYMREALGENELPNLARAWSLQPGLAEQWIALSRHAREAAGLDMRAYEVLLTRITYNLKCAYVTINHAFLLYRLGCYTEQEVIDLIHDWQQADLSQQDRAMLGFADKLCAGSHRITRQDVDCLRKSGFADAQIVGLIFLMGWLITDAVVPNALGPEPDVYSARMRRVVDWETPASQGAAAGTQGGSVA